MLTQIFDKYGPLGASAYIILGIALVAINVFAVLQLLRFLFLELLPGMIEETAQAVDHSMEEMQRTRSTFYRRLESIPDSPPKRTNAPQKTSRQQPAPHIAPSRPAQAPRIATGKQLPAVSSGKRPPSIASRNGGGRA